MKPTIYLDNNGTTQIDSRVIDAMVEEMRRGPSNPSSLHSYGRAARSRLALAREQIASFLGAAPGELIFTASGTEALNLALLGQRDPGHTISTRAEHSAVYETLKRVQGPTTMLPLTSNGQIDPGDLEKSLTPETRLIVLSAANSETGVLAPLEEIASIAKARSIPLLVDGVQLLGRESFTIPDGVGAIAFSGHKFHGPKGVGLLVVKKNYKLDPLITGGGQERTLRSGTENLPGILGFAKALEILEEELPAATERMSRLRDQFEKGLKNLFPSAQINGAGRRLCNTTNVLFPGVDGEGLLIHLDQQGIAASMGSACSSGSHEPSRTLLAMGLTRSEAMSSLRFSLSRFTGDGEIEEALKRIGSLKA